MARLKGRLALAAVFALVLTGGSVLAAAPAQAHTADSAVLYGCGSSYVRWYSRSLTTAGGATYGVAVMAGIEGTGWRCVVTYKTAFHGTPSKVAAYIQSYDSQELHYNVDPSAAHWESVKYYGSRNSCFKYLGQIYSPGGTLATMSWTSWGWCFR